MITAPPHACTYLCNGSQTEFDFHFRVLADSDLVVLHIPPDADAERLTLQSDYSVVRTSAGGTVTTLAEAPYAGGHKIMIWLDVPLVQPVDYVENDAFPAQSHEDALDRLTLMAAQSRAEVGRSLHVPLGSDGQVLPNARDRAGRFLAFDANGNVIVTPAIADPIVIEEMDQARLYFDRNGDTLPRLVIDPAGLGSGVADDIGGDGAVNHSTVMLQDVIPLQDASMQRFWIGMKFDSTPPAGEPEPSFKSRRSRFAVGIQVVNQISAQYDAAGDTDNDEANGPFFAQEAGCLALAATAHESTRYAKVEALVVSAKEDEGVDPTAGSKGVAVQAITVRNTPGAKPDSRGLLQDGDNDGYDDIEPDGVNVGSITIRCNGGTVSTPPDENNVRHAVYGGYRSWGVLMAGGRAGYLNGVVLGKRHGFKEGQDPGRDFENVGGWGGVWGGRGFWHDNIFATYCKESCPGWVTIGHDGVPQETDGTDGIARAPIDIEVPLAPSGAVPSAWNETGTGGSVLMFKGARLLAPRKTGWTVPAGAASRAGFDTETATLTDVARTLKALIEDLYRDETAPLTFTGHGLIGK